MSGPTWTCTRSQLIGALANIEVRHVKLTGPMAGKVIADDVADAILSQLPRAAESTQDGAESHREALNDAGQVSWDSGWEGGDHAACDAAIARLTAKVAQCEDRLVAIRAYAVDPATADAVHDALMVLLDGEQPAPRVTPSPGQAEDRRGALSDAETAERES